MNKLLVIVALMGTLTAFAQEQPQRPPQGRGPGMGQGRGGFALVMDTNKDGKVTKDEVLAWFEKVDTNKDGVLTEEELRAVRPQGPGGPPADRPQRGQRPTSEQK
jgi:hypothetical protein